MNRFGLIHVAITGALIVLIVLVLSQDSVAPSKGAIASSSAPSASRVADFVKVGDKFGVFTVKSIPRIGIDQYEVRFSGETTVSGRFYERTYDGVIVDDLCFEPSDETASSIPQLMLAKDALKPWFCFENDAAARQELEKSGAREGNARIVIKDYVSRRGPNEVTDTVTFVRVAL